MTTLVRRRTFGGARSVPGLPVGVDAAVIAWLAVAFVLTLVLGLARACLLGSRATGSVTWE